MVEDLLNALISKHKGTVVSKNWKHWVAQLDIKTCLPCRENHGKIYPISEYLTIEPPLHMFCRCAIEIMKAIVAGYATKDGTAGADYWLRNYQQLPSNYIPKYVARKLGWKASKGNLQDVLPNAIIGGDRYYNDDGHLPEADGRIWYEADINYLGGFRGFSRILFSSDGLIFVTYDHYRTFYEIV